jgi:hypothetical protein
MKSERSSGNGPVCITDPDHKESIILPSGRAWCPHHAHDHKDAPTPWLDKQPKAEDEAVAS